MKRWIKWIVVAIVVAVLAASIGRLMAARKEKQQALQAQQDAQKVQTKVKLVANDVFAAQQLDMVQTLAISGPLKAANSAFVKARVAGELQAFTVREGDYVKAGQVIGRIDATEVQARLRQAQQQAESAKGQVDIAKRSFENNRSLVEQGFISKTALDTSMAALASAEASYRAAQAGTDVIAKSLEDTILRAPISGQVSQRLAQSGERVAIDVRIAEIVDLSQMEMEASLSPAESVGVQVGQNASLTVEGVVQPMEAKVARVNPAALAGSRAVLVYLTVSPQAGLRQGLFAQGNLQTASSRVLAVPLSAVRTDKPQPYVQVIAQDKVSHQTVQVGLRGRSGDQTVVAIQGIQENALILNGTVGKLREGTLVEMPQGSK
ncbi:efflux RND transporter periplasmic adaptor subunit [Rhodoferax aquaticus]|uniref:Efflux RND transporter periplasmic adaptor subunit n=1 Tax=Rhodoferax aquaticus TaxID=2527691 RepID=A0A515EMJ0_9BURK|nr:efflux RND transporter periplasmic adaptor subunit [Rhodoferax aquaticus]QDL53887.1 efflux RND transporter periplasmic adaptor subunit [Rhodoferax aquaticus]